ncbi:hypothetical protein ACFYP4_00600 [Streptomyces sp. NPDC005551]|uniref:hypothetical protein n=1 Tax=Streptomyces sp. NPDC005551 TaxID=3364725 RepID=UPI0036B35573
MFDQAAEGSAVRSDAFGRARPTRAPAEPDHFVPDYIVRDHDRLLMVELKRYWRSDMPETSSPVAARRRPESQGIVWHTTGSGKSMTMAWLIHQALRLDRALEFVREARENYDSAELTRRLLASVEEETRLPSITAPRANDEIVWGAPAGAPAGLVALWARFDALPSTEEIAAEEARVAALQLLVAARLDELCDVGGDGISCEMPVTESAPCGVLRLAATSVPRAPQPLGTPLVTLAA